MVTGHHPGGNPGANLKSFSHRCHLILVAFVWELTKETIELPLGCLQCGGLQQGCVRMGSVLLFFWVVLAPTTGGRWNYLENGSAFLKRNAPLTAELTHHNRHGAYA